MGRIPELSRSGKKGKLFSFSVSLVKFSLLFCRKNVLGRPRPILLTNPRIHAATAHLMLTQICYNTNMLGFFSKSHIPELRTLEKGRRRRRKQSNNAPSLPVSFCSAVRSSLSFVGPGVLHAALSLSISLPFSAFLTLSFLPPAWLPFLRPLYMSCVSSCHCWSLIYPIFAFGRSAV